MDYSDHYNADYWMGKKTYSPDGKAQLYYHGPSLSWSGFDYVVNSLTPLLPGNTLLDIGCGAGDLAHRFMKKGYDPYGIDVSQFAIENCHLDMRGRLAIRDITQAPSLPHHWPKSFDIVMATDLLEHIYLEDLENTFQWMMGLSKRWLFFLVAVTTAEDHKQEFIAKKGEPIPPEWVPTAISGHVNVRNWKWWVKFFRAKGLTIRWDLGYIFQLERELIPDFKATGGWNMGSTWILEKS